MLESSRKFGNMLTNPDPDSVIQRDDAADWFLKCLKNGVTDFHQLPGPGCHHQQVSLCSIRPLLFNSAAVIK